LSSISIYKKFMGRLKFQELYLELSYLCNAECSHCYVSSSPFADRTKLPLDVCCRIIEESLSLDAIDPKIAIAGGEPTLFWEELLTVIKYASERNVRVILISNGWWGKNPAICRQKLDALIEHGLGRLELSTSNYHRQYVDAEAIDNIILLSRDRPLEVALHVRFSNSCSEKRNLSSFKDLGQVELISYPITPVGRAKTSITRDEFSFATDFPRGNCRDDLSLLINPKGDCFPCCGGAELTEALRLGNIHEESLTAIVERAEKRKLLHHLTQKGPAVFADALRADGFTELKPSDCVSICDLCTSIFKSPKLSLGAERWVNSPSSLRSLNSSFENSASLAEPFPELPVFSEDPMEFTLEEIVEQLPDLANGAFRSEYLNACINTAPSGANLSAVGNYYVKWASHPRDAKLLWQAQWLERMRAQGVRCVPEVLAKYSDGNGFTAYVVPKYLTNLSSARAHRSLETAKKILSALESIWNVPPDVSRQPDWEGYGRQITTLLARYEPSLSAEFARLAEKVIRLNEGRTDCCTVHGDPTFENIVYDAGGNMILLDPNRQVAPAVCVPELDVAKIMQSLFGWEAFVYHQKTHLQVNTELRPTVEARFGPNGWITCVWLMLTHLVRTLPYGANVGNAACLLPSIKTFLDYLAELSDAN